MITEQEALAIAARIRASIDGDTSGCDRWFNNYSHDHRDATEEIRALAEFVLSVNDQSIANEMIPECSACGAPYGQAHSPMCERIKQ